MSVHAALRASSNLREIKVGSRIVYLEALPPPYTTLNSDIVVVLGTGDESARPQLPDSSATAARGGAHRGPLSLRRRPVQP